MLVDLADIKTYLGETTTDYDTFLTDAETLVSNAIQNYCGRVFSETSYIQTYHYSDFEGDETKDQLFLYHYPLTTITHIKEVEDGTETTLTATDYRIHNPTGRILRVDSGVVQSWFSGFNANSYIEVSYDAGYATIPPEIKQVVLELVEDRYNKKVNGVAQGFGNDVQRVSIPGTISVDFDYSLQNNERKSRFGMFVGSYGNILDFWRSERACVGEIKVNYVS